MKRVKLVCVKMDRKVEVREDVRVKVREKMELGEPHQGRGAV